MPKSLSARTLSPPPPRKTKRRAGFEALITFFKRDECNKESSETKSTAHVSFFSVYFLSLRVRQGVFSKKENRQKTKFRYATNLTKQAPRCNEKKQIEVEKISGLPRRRFATPRNDGKKAAFTLAETLITLTIIGVIAALTVPNLLSKYQEQVTVNKVKKFHSNLTQALPQAIREYGPLDTWDLQKYSQSSTEKIYQQLFKPYFKIAKDCGVNNNGNCLADVIYKSFNNNIMANYSSNAYYYKFLLNDGSTVVVRSAFDKLLDGDYYYAAVFYDVNGVKEPNHWGKDMFSFAIAKDSVRVPGSPNSNILFSDSGSGQQGTAWLIYMGNMDYLRCPEKLSWDGKHSCKE